MRGPFNDTEHFCGLVARKTSKAAWGVLLPWLRNVGMTGLVQVLPLDQDLIVGLRDAVVYCELDSVSWSDAGLAKLDEWRKIASASMRRLAPFVVGLFLFQLVLYPLLPEAPQFCASRQLLFAVASGQSGLTPHFVVLGHMSNQLASHNLESAR